MAARPDFEGFAYDEPTPWRVRAVAYLHERASFIALAFVLVLIHYTVPEKDQDLASLTALVAAAFFRLDSKLDEIIRRLP